MIADSGAPPIPKHVAIVMDGNGRWAEQRTRPRVFGHRAGVKAVRITVEAAARAGVEALTLFAFSSENWQRPGEEVRGLMDLFLRAMRSESKALNKDGVRLRFIGERARFSPALQEQMLQVEALTETNRRLQLNVAVNYGGRWDIVQAAQRAAAEALAGRLQVADLDEAKLAGFFSLADLPPPDLFIRTGGEVRISNFLLWQLAYTELVFSPVLWPDFNAQSFQAALDDFAQRQRRFGKTAAQQASPA